MNNKEAGVLLTATCFNKLIECLHQEFKKRHSLKSLPKSFQLYGYGNFEEDKPNLKTDFELMGYEAINGKYLYDKSRSIQKGKPTVKLNHYYKNVLLTYLGYKSLHEFLDANPLSEEEISRQLNYIKPNNEKTVYYYVTYFFGEDKRMLKAQTIISDNFKKIQHTYLYPQEDKTFKEHYSFGRITRREDTIHITTKTLLDGKKLEEGSSEVYYIGHDEPDNISFLVGTYCGYDIYTHIVAGKSILEKCSSKEEMIIKSTQEYIPAYIAQEIRNCRITCLNKVPKNHLELSHKSPYASIYKSLAGTYKLTFFDKGTELGKFNFSITGQTYKIIPLEENVYVEYDNIDLFNRGSVVNFKFCLAGVTPFDRLDIYLKTYYLNDSNKIQEGAFSGVDKENKLINGSVTLQFTAE